MDLRLDDHPNELITDVRVIRADGYVIGYCGLEPGRPISLLYDLSESERSQVENFVRESVGQPSMMTWPPIVTPRPMKRIEQEE